MRDPDTDTVWSDLCATWHWSSCFACYDVALLLLDRIPRYSYTDTDTIRVYDRWKGYKPKYYPPTASLIPFRPPLHLLVILLADLGTAIEPQAIEFFIQHSGAEDGFRDVACWTAAESDLILIVVKWAQETL